MQHEVAQRLPLMRNGAGGRRGYRSNLNSSKFAVDEPISVIIIDPVGISFARAPMRVLTGDSRGTQRLKSRSASCLQRVTSMADPQSPRSPQPGRQPLRSAERPPLNQVIEALRSLRYGRVEILVQDGHIVLVEKHERERVFHD